MYCDDCGRLAMNCECHDVVTCKIDSCERCRAYWDDQELDWAIERAGESLR